MKGLAANVGYVLLCAMAGVLLAAVAVKLQQHFAPIVLFPLLVGIAAGLVGHWLAEFCTVRRNAVVLTAGLICATFAALAQHGFAYRETCQKIADSKNDVREALLAQLGLPKTEPTNFPDYLLAEARLGRQFGPWRIQGPWAWAMWGGDFVFTLLGATITMKWLRSQQRRVSADE